MEEGGMKESRIIASNKEGYKGLGGEGVYRRKRKISDAQKKC